MISRLFHRATVSSVVLASAASAQPANDDCANASAIAGYGTYPWNVAGAITDGLGTAVCLAFGSDQIYNDVWFCWTAPESGPVIARTCGSTAVDTKIAVYAGCGCPEGSGILACNDDSCGLQSSLVFDANAGASYMFRVGLYAALDPNSSASITGNLEILSGLPPVVHGPVVHPQTSHSYYLIGPAVWSASRARALALGGELVTINDAAENEFVRSMVLRFDGADRRAWIGLTDREVEGVFVWLSGEPVTYTNWSGGEPNNSGGVEDVVEMFGNGLWNDNRENPPLSVFGLAEVPPAPSCPGDVDGDNDVDLTDLATLLTNFGLPSGATRAMGDLDGDGDVDLTDLATLLSHFGTICR